MSRNALTFQCSVCGKEFPATPDATVELNWEPELVPAGAADDNVTRDDLVFAGRETLQQLGLTEDQRDALLSGKPVVTAACICLACQDAAHDEQCGGEA